MQFPEVLIKKTIASACALDEPSACQGIFQMYLDIMMIVGDSIDIVNNKYGIRCPPSMFLDGSANAYTIVIEASASGSHQGVSIDVTVSLNRPLNLPSRGDSVTCLNPTFHLPEQLRLELFKKLEEIWQNACGLPALSRCSGTIVFFPS